MRLPLPALLDFRAALEGDGVNVKGLVVDDKGTLCAPGKKKEVTASTKPNSPGSSDSSSQSLAPLQLATSEKPPQLPVLTGQDDAEILLHGELSRGGMGKVFLGEQVSIGREVAIKIANDDAAAAALIGEGRVTGQLEHPNIVPVHQLGTSSTGKPLLVMKRIEGESWKALLKTGAVLARDVDIVMDVCRALSFAHARGVVHRDVKPANVMVGRFGEVYLLDWGIAVGFGDEAPIELPRADDVHGVAGTPGYMAPEMALPGGVVDVRTDVYLVGAVLFELLTGKAPHKRATVEESLHAAHTADAPVFDSGDVDEELGAVCRRAMARDPAARFQTIEELRAALVVFQSHAVARALCAEAQERLSTLQALPKDADARDVQRTFTECRFGFSQALRTWPSSTSAHEGLQAAIATMARREVAAGHADSAALLVTELDDKPADLVEQLDALSHQRAREVSSVRELERITHESDRRIAARETSAMLLASGGGWLALMIVLDVVKGRGLFVAGPGTFSVFMAAFAAVIAVAGVALPRLRATEASRSTLATMFSCVAALATVHGLGFVFSVAPGPMLAIGHTVLAATSVVFLQRDRALWPSTVLAWLIVPVCAVFPDQAHLVSGVGGFIVLAVIAVVWRSR